MISMEEVEQAVNRLEEAGFHIFGRFNQTDFEQFKDGGLFCARKVIVDPSTGSEDKAASIQDSFLVDYQNYGSTYAAYFLLGQINVPIRTSNNLSTVISAAIDYFEMRSRLPGRHLKWSSLSDDTNGIVTASYWLNQAGALAEIMSASALQATFADLIYMIELTEHGYGIKVNNQSLPHVSTLEDAVLSILAHQYKNSLTKED